MRWLAATLFFSGCFSPKVPDGVRCDPANPACPTGQTCVTQAGASTCTAMPLGPDAPAAVDAAADAAPDAPPDAQTQFAYTPSIVACIDPTAAPPDPAACATSAGPNSIRVDAQDGTTPHPWDGFVRVDLDNAFAGMTVTAVHLQLTVSTSASSDSTNTGLVYRSTPFTAADLSMAEPAKASGTALAQSQGSAAPQQTIDWALPASLVSPGGSVYLELETPSANAVMYWDLAGMVPPKLIVDVM